MQSESVLDRVTKRLHGNEGSEAPLPAEWRYTAADGPMRLFRSGTRPDSWPVSLVVSATAHGSRRRQHSCGRPSKRCWKSSSSQTEKQGVKKMARELTEFGGEAAVRQTMEQVARETGEEGVVNLVRLSKSYGIDAMRAAKVAPRLTANYIDRVSPDLVPGALAGAGPAGRASHLDETRLANWCPAPSKRPPAIRASGPTSSTNSASPASERASGSTRMR